MRALGCRLRGPEAHQGIRAIISHAQRSAMPQEVDQRPTFDVIYDQEEIGSCVPNSALGGCQQRMAMQGLGTWTPARLPVYRLALEADKAFPTDEGTWPETVLKILSEQGFADEALAPYVGTQAGIQRPIPAAYITAAKRTRLVSWQPLLREKDDVQFELFSGNAVIFSMLLRESFEDVGSDGIAKVPGPREEEIGGHEMRAVGYNPVGLIVANSWGRSFGKNGYVVIPWAMILDRYTTRSIHSIQVVQAV